MSTPQTPPTRRELRERLAREAAAAASGSGGDETTQGPTQGEVRAPATPAAGAGAQTPQAGSATPARGVAAARRTGTPSPAAGIARAVTGAPAAQSTPAAGTAAEPAPVTSGTAVSRRALRNRPVASVGPDGLPGGETPYQAPGLAQPTDRAAAFRTRRSIRATQDPVAGTPEGAGTAPADTPTPARGTAAAPAQAPATAALPTARAGGGQAPDRPSTAARPSASGPGAPAPTASAPTAAATGTSGSPTTVTRQSVTAATAAAAAPVTPAARAEPASDTAGSLRAAAPSAPASGPVRAGGAASATQPAAARPPAPAGPVAPPVIGDEDEIDVPVPQWKSLQTADEPTPVTATTPPWLGGLTGPDAAPEPIAQAAEEAPPTEEDVEPEKDRGPRSYPYTWLQMILLAVVAFVIGFLVWWVAQAANDRSSALAPAVDHVAAADAWTAPSALR